MPLPFIVGAIAAIAGAGGIGAGIHGGVKMKQASDTVKAAQKRNEENIEKLKNKGDKSVGKQVGNAVYIVYYSCEYLSVRTAVVIFKGQLLQMRKQILSHIQHYILTDNCHYP